MTPALHRGWKVADAKGLVLHSVVYPPGFDDPTRLLYPHLVTSSSDGMQQELAPHGAQHFPLTDQQSQA